jgi:hypothetical protein
MLEIISWVMNSHHALIADRGNPGGVAVLHHVQQGIKKGHAFIRAWEALTFPWFASRDPNCPIHEIMDFGYGHLCWPGFSGRGSRSGKNWRAFRTLFDL